MVLAGVGAGRVRGGGSGPVRAWPDVLAEFGDVLPTYPDARVIPEVRIPAPPQLADHDDVRKHVLQLALTYRGALMSKCNVKGSHPLIRGVWTGMNVSKMASSDKLSGAVVMMLGHNIAPAAWCAFSIDVWKHLMQKPEPPPMVWVYSAARIAEHIDWFHDERAQWSGNRVHPNEAQRNLLRVYSAIQHELLRLPVLDRDTVASVVRRHSSALPMSWELHVAEACAAAHAATKTVGDALRRGDFIW
jgi:hypothetical protein